MNFKKITNLFKSKKQKDIDTIKYVKERGRHFGFNWDDIPDEIILKGADMFMKMKAPVTNTTKK